MSDVKSQSVRLHVRLEVRCRRTAPEFRLQGLKATEYFQDTPRLNQAVHNKRQGQLLSLHKQVNDLTESQQLQCRPRIECSRRRIGNCVCKCQELTWSARGDQLYLTSIALGTSMPNLQPIGFPFEAYTSHFVPTPPAAVPPICCSTSVQCSNSFCSVVPFPEESSACFSLAHAAPNACVARAERLLLLPPAPARRRLLRRLLLILPTTNY